MINEQFDCYFHFPLSGRPAGQCMECWLVQGSVSCVIHPQPLWKVRQSYITRIWGHLYFLLFLKG